MGGSGDVRCAHECGVRGVCRRATGELVTPATWIRGFVQSHPDYKQDSIIPPSTAYDLLQACQAIGEGRRPCPEIHGGVVIER